MGKPICAKVEGVNVTKLIKFLNQLKVSDQKQNQKESIEMIKKWEKQLKK